MGSEWQVCQWGDLATLEYGKSLRGYEQKGGKYRVYGTNGAIGWHDQYLYQQPSVIIGRKGAYRGVHYAPQPFFVIDTAFYLKPKTKFDMRWAYYQLLTQDINQMDSGSAIPSTSREEFYHLPVLLPPYETQQQIGKILKTFDDKIELNGQTNASLEKIAQALFKSWFVDFDPVKARSKGQPPESMALATAALFPNEFESCGLEVIPKGWSARSFGSLVQLTIGGDWGTEQADDTHQTKVAVIRGTDIPSLRSGSYDGVPRRYVQPNKLLKRMLKDGDIIIEVSGGSRDQATGRSLYITDELLGRFEEPAIPASFCRLLRGVSKEVSLLLAIHLRYLYDNGGTWEYQSQSTGISNFQTGHFLNNERVIIPDQNVLSKFWEITRPLVQKQSSNEIITLTKIRDSLIPKLISGQLRIPDAEKSEGDTP